MEERTKGSHESIHKIQEEKAVIEHVTWIGRGVTKQNRMQIGVMAQNEDISATQAHCNMHVVTTMKRAELTQKMIEMQISMRENMGDGAAKEKTYESIQDLFDKSEDLQTQLQDVGLEERVSNPIVLSVFSNLQLLWD